MIFSRNFPCSGDMRIRKKFIFFEKDIIFKSNKINKRITLFWETVWVLETYQDNSSKWEIFDYLYGERVYSESIGKSYLKLKLDDEKIEIKSLEDMINSGNTADVKLALGIIKAKDLFQPNNFRY